MPHVYLEECEELTDAEFGRLMWDLLRYSMTGEPIPAEGAGRYYAKRMMNQEDVHSASYARTAAKRSEAGKRGAEARWQTHGLPQEG